MSLLAVVVPAVVTGSRGIVHDTTVANNTPRKACENVNLAKKCIRH